MLRRVETEYTIPTLLSGNRRPEAGDVYAWRKILSGIQPPDLDAEMRFADFVYRQAQE